MDKGDLNEKKVDEFLDKVFTEVAQLFPFVYIHMGGDETARNYWEKSGAVKELIKYAPSMYDPSIKAGKDSSGKLWVDLETEIEGLALHYSFDNSFPDHFYPRYTTSIPVPKDASAMKVISYRNDKPIGRMITIPVTELQRRADRKRNQQGCEFKL